MDKKNPKMAKVAAGTRMKRDRSKVPNTRTSTDDGSVRVKLRTKGSSGRRAGCEKAVLDGVAAGNAVLSIDSSFPESSLLDSGEILEESEVESDIQSDLLRI